MVSRQCTWCRFAQEFYARDMAEELTSYLESLPPEIKVDRQEHQRRLAICSKCDGNAGGLCRYCGCYIAARTVKKALACPHPGGERWPRYTDSGQTED